MPNSHDITRIAAQAIVSHRTVERVYRGGGNTYSRRRVTEAAKALDLPMPPEPLAPSSEPLPSKSPTTSKAA